MSNTSIFQEYLMISTLLMVFICIFIFFSPNVGWLASEVGWLSKLSRHRAVTSISKSAYRKGECYRPENITLCFMFFFFFFFFFFFIFYWACSIVLILIHSETPPHTDSLIFNLKSELRFTFHRGNGGKQSMMIYYVPFITFRLLNSMWKRRS